MNDSKPLVVGFRGADVYFAPPNLGNAKLNDIGARVGATMFSSLEVRRAFRYLLAQLDTNHDGVYDPARGDERRDIIIFGHSWGAVSAVKLAQRIGASPQFVDPRIKLVAVIDPVLHLRRHPIRIGTHVQRFWNRYQTAGHRPIRCGPVLMYGKQLPVAAGVLADQRDLNPPPGTGCTSRIFPDIASTPAPLNHWWLIWEVEEELVKLLGE